MQSHDTPFPSSGDNFRTLARADSDLELSLLILELVSPLLDDDCTPEELAEDYAVVMAEFGQQLECTGTDNGSLSGKPAHTVTQP